MSHGTHHDEAQDKKKSIVSFQSSFWFVIILVFLFVAALNFVNAEKGGEEHGSPTEKTEVKQEVGNKSGDIEQKPTGTPQEGTSNTHAAATTGTDTAAAKAH